MPGPADLLPPFLLALVLVPLLARLAPALGMVDVPSARSSHARPVARTGGLAVALALGAVALPHLLGDAPERGAWARLLLPALAFFLVGLADDVRRLPPVVKLALQVGAAALAVLLGLRWEGRALGPFGALDLGAMTAAMTVLWLVATVNLVNILDGIDLITCALAVVVLAAGAGGGAGPGAGALYGAAAAAVLALAAWNVAPARAFPGDGGTHLLGFLVGAVACGSPGGPASIDPLPWAAASAPLLPGVIDVAWGIGTKRRMGMDWGAAHREHLYQRLTRAGWSHALVALRYGLLAALAVFLVARVAPRLGLLACLGISAPLLGAHLLHGLRVARRETRRLAGGSRDGG